jgi:hypothetical protein
MPPARRSTRPGIVINIPGLEASTRVGDLTLEQLVLVIHSVVSQTTTRPRALSPAELSQASEQIAAIIRPGKGGKATALQQGISDMQSALLKQLPEISREIAEQATTRGVKARRGK